MHQHSRQVLRRGGVERHGTHWLAALRTCSLTFLLCTGTAIPSTTEGADPIVVWLLPTDAERFPASGGFPTAEQQRQFFDDTAGFFREYHRETLAPSVAVTDIRNKTLQDPVFARQVLGQRGILRALSQFARERAIDRTIVVRFFDWVEILDVLENLPAGRNDIPHVIVTPSTWVGYLADKGVLRPIGSVDGSRYIDRILDTCRVRRRVPGWPWADRVSGRVMRAFDVERGWPEIVALPWSIDLRLFFFRKDLFGDSPPRDRQQFLEMARDIATRMPAVTPFALATEADWDLLHSFSLVLWGSGGDWMRSRHVISGDASRDAAKFLLALRQAGAASFRQVPRAALEQQFLDGSLASVVSGPWMLGRLNLALGPQWHRQIGVALPPFNVEGQQPVTYLGGLHLGLTGRGEIDPVARHVLGYLTHEAALRQLESAVTVVPASRAAFERLARSFPSESGLRNLLPQAIRNAQHYPVIPEWASIVEAQSTRLGLFQFFKHIREDQEQLAERDLTALQRRFEWDIRLVPRLWAASAASLIAVCAFAYLWFAHRQRTLRNQLNAIRRQCAVADIELQKTRNSLASLSGIARPDAPDGNLSQPGTDRARDAGEVARVHQAVREQLDRLLDLQHHKTTWQINEQTLLRGLGGSRGPIKDIPRVAPFLPPLSDVLLQWLTPFPPEAPDLLLADAHPPRNSATVRGRTPLDDIVGESLAIRRLKTAIEQVAASNAKILLTGEVGSGKDLVARAVHALSGRDGPFVSIDCASFPADMLEAQLFGIGPDSGLPAVARQGRAGYLEQANGGTAFFDEIGKMPLAQQAKLLRVLETGRVIRVMDRTGRGTALDVRIVAAYSVDLADLAAAGAFDRALLSRLEEIPIQVPPLRERRDDIPLLVDHFLHRLGREHGRTVVLLPDAYRRIQAFEFYDNVRGLHHLVSRIVLMGKNMVSGQDLESVLPRREAVMDRDRLVQAVRSTALRAFVACAAFIADSIQEFFPRPGLVPAVNPDRVGAALARIRRGLPRVAEFEGEEYELPDTASAVVYRAVAEKDDLNVHFLYLLVMETLSGRGYHTGVGSALPRNVREQIEYVRRSLFYSEPVGRKARKTLKWQGIALSEIVTDASRAHRAELCVSGPRCPDLDGGCALALRTVSEVAPRPRTANAAP